MASGPIKPQPTTGYLVYIFTDPRDMLPFYIGITSRPTSRWASHNSRGAGSRAYGRLNELHCLGLKCRVRIVASGLPVQEAREREAALIRQHRATLLNGAFGPQARRPKLRLVA